jgi:hypothetical protein
VTSQKPGTPHSVDSDSPDTEVIAVSSPASVFVDSTGRRRRLLRRVSYVFGGLCMVYGGLVSVSLAGGPVSSSAVLPLPDLRHDDTEEAAAGPRPAPIPVPSASSRPLESYVADVVPRRRATANVTRIAPRPPAPRASVKPSTSPAPSSAKPVESTTKPSTPAPSATTLLPPLPTKTPVVVPPAPPVPQSGTGGSGGGAEVPDEDQDETSSETSAEPAARETTDSADTPEPSVSAEQPA